MIKKTLLIIGSLAVSGLIALSACKSNNAAVFSNSNQSALKNQLQSSISSNVKHGSLWNSELFNDSRFMLDIKLSKAEKKEAKKLARSFEPHMKSSTLFMHYLLSELKKRNLPLELAALPMLESGFNPRAKSHAGAHGPWQFIRSTGKTYGLERSSNYDEFYDFIESTDASLKFLQHLYNACNKNWYLAIAAYNQGEFAVKKAISRAKKSGVPAEKISINNVKLSRYAYVYVKRFKAYADILRNPETYGVKRPEIENRPAFRRVAIAGRINSMKKAAELSGVGIKTLQHLNAGYLSDSLKSNKQRGLLVPIDHASKLEDALGVKDNTTLDAQNLSFNR